MRLRPAHLLMILAFVMAGCRSEDSAEPPAPVPIELASAPAQPDDSTDAGAEAPGEVDQDPAEPDPEPALDPMDPRHFAGFSKDESRFAYGAFSKGARMYLFTVVEAATGKRVTDFPLDGAAGLDRARSLLEAGDFEPESADPQAALMSDESLKVEVEGGEVRVWLVQSGHRARLEPPAAYAEAVRRFRNADAELWGFSPHGTYVAVRIVEDQGAILGQATTYQVLSLPQARVALQ